MNAMGFSLGRWLAAIGVVVTAALPASAQTKPWRHGVIEPKSDSGFILMATQNGFAKKYGIELEIVPVKNETLGLRALISGELESYEGSPPFAAIVRGAEVKEIGCPWLGIPHVVFARTGIATMKDLDGKTMATSAPGSMPDLVAHAALEHFNIPAANVRLANVGSDSDRYRSLVSGIVDAAVISSEYTPIIDTQKVHPLTTASVVAPDFLRICYQTTAKVIASRPEDAARFLAMQMDAWHYALGHKAETVALAQKSTGQKPDDTRAAFVFDELARTHQVDPTIPLPLDRIASMQNSLLRLGVIAKTVDVSTMVDEGPRKRALALVGK